MGVSVLAANMMRIIYTTVSSSFAACLVCAVLCVIIAGKKNRSKLGWGILGFVFNIISLIIIAVLPRK